ncbi:E3 ubiquitin-protein ligase DTX3L [Pholidichthys leucotaenia]
MEFIRDITLIIDGTCCKEPGQLKEILHPFNPEKNHSFYRVRGTFEQLDNLVSILRSPRCHSSPTARAQTHHQAHRSSAHVEHVDVSRDVMDYIKQNCPEKLQKIQGKRFVIETLTEHRRGPTEPGSMVQVTIRPLKDSVHTAELVRQRFITFYQRTASDLQVISLNLSPRNCTDLQGKFPHLLFNCSSSKQEVKIIGHFAHIAKLKEFLSQKTNSSISLPVDIVPADASSSRTSGPSQMDSNDSEGESCPICMEPIEPNEKKTLSCKHSFCKDCLKRAFDYKPVCPTCGTLHGTLTGTQPDGGTMDVTIDLSPLPGYEKYKTIVIRYYIPSGIQKKEHPNPGQPYEGASRRAYLPDSPEGQQVLSLLKRAFKQRLIFTVGRSATSGRNNIVTWNDIHHKTSMYGGPTCFGYPDPDYLSRVRDELKVKGIK